jgi:alpha-beta hydrolase superfamily lysophospholipase
VTRCTLDAPAHGPTSPIPGEDAYVVVLQTGQPSYRELWLEIAGSTDKTLKLYDGAFHDLLNDTGQNEVMGDIERWIDADLTA